MNTNSNGESTEKKTIWSDIRKHDKYRVVSELVSDGQESPTYYSLLVLSAIIISAGLLLANSAILIGGMLVTPVLTPILLLALGIVTSKPRVIRTTAKLIAKSVGLIFAVAFLASLVFDTPNSTEFFDSVLFNNTINAAFLYFVVAFASGVAATFAWIRKEVSNMLPGISIAVSLVPPIALVGVWLAQVNLDNARFFFLVFLFNLFGLITSSMIIFSILGFSHSADEVSHNFNSLQKDGSISNGKGSETIKVPTYNEPKSAHNDGPDHKDHNEPKNNNQKNEQSKENS
jgi:uncharacterized hydrophobic protein (TIGR00271 family)